MADVCSRYTGRHGSALDEMYPMRRKNAQERSILRLLVDRATSIAACVIGISCLGSPLLYARSAPPPPAPVLLDAMTAEMARAIADLRNTPASTDQDAPLPPYFLSYAAADLRTFNITAQFGALVSSKDDHSRSVDVLVRVGDGSLDNTHGNHRSSALTTVALPLTDDRHAIERSLWWGTNTGYGNALHNYMQVNRDAGARAGRRCFP